MSVLEEQLMNELRTLGPTAHLIAVCDMAKLDNALRCRVREQYAEKTIPLLRNPDWHALLPYGPLLLTADSADEKGHYRLICSFSGDLRDAVHGWIVSSVAPEHLAEHLARAAVAYGPEGSAHLLRYYDPLILPVLYRRAPPLWWREFITPVASWWVPRGDTQIQRWGRIPGPGTTHPNLLSPLMIDQTLWQSLTGDSLPHRLLQTVEADAPDLLDSTCRGVRLACIESLVASARQAGLARHDDLHDYVFLALASGGEKALGGDRGWSMALEAAVAGKGRLGDLYLSYRHQQA